MQNKYNDEIRGRFCERWKRSGKSKRNFCKDVGISVLSLNKWLKKFDQKQIVNYKTFEAVKFLPAEEDAIVDQKTPVEIKLPNGILIKIETNSISNLIAELLR